jgi:hypothetical protein
MSRHPRLRGQRIREAMPSPAPALEPEREEGRQSQYSQANSQPTELGSGHRTMTQKHRTMIPPRDPSPFRRSDTTVHRAKNPTAPTTRCKAFLAIL